MLIRMKAEDSRAPCPSSEGVYLPNKFTMFRMIRPTRHLDDAFHYEGAKPHPFYGDNETFVNPIEFYGNDFVNWHNNPPAHVISEYAEFVNYDEDAMIFFELDFVGGNEAIYK